MAKLTSPVMVSVMSCVPLANGCHYWKVRIDQFSGTGNNGFVAVGVAKEMDDEGVIGKMIKKHFACCNCCKAKN